MSTQFRVFNAIVKEDTRRTLRRKRVLTYEKVRVSNRLRADTLTNWIRVFSRPIHGYYIVKTVVLCTS